MRRSGCRNPDRVSASGDPNSAKHKTKNDANCPAGDGPTCRTSCHARLPLSAKQPRSRPPGSLFLNHNSATLGIRPDYRGGLVHEQALFGDNLAVLGSKSSGIDDQSLDLIYLDPPFQFQSRVPRY